MQGKQTREQEDQDLAGIEEGNDMGLNRSKSNSDAEKNEFKRYKAVVPTDLGDQPQVGPEIFRMALSFIDGGRW